MDVLERITGVWQYLFAGLTLLISLVASGHALLYKRDSRAVVLWVGFIWLLPLVGALLYFLLGINRIRRRAMLLRGRMERFQADPGASVCAAETIHETLPDEARHFGALARLVEKVVARPLAPGNLVTMLVNGDVAYPEMLKAIGQARESITLGTYIFDNDPVGRAFARALGDAVRRGVEVRVLIDATGTRYSWPPILGVLRREGVRFARFNPAFPLWRLVALNLRNHRKILVVDGRVGFTGGMNIRSGHQIKDDPRWPVQDLHFRVEGPVVVQLQEVFADDWQFTTGEALRGEIWFPLLESRGPVLARAIVDGPDEDFEKLRWALLGALSCAQSCVRVMTPYFLPDPAIISALDLAALRGVEVDILLPEKSNLPFVHWASRAQWWQVLRRGCRIWLTPPPFDHSKLMLVDGHWALVGSANWDPRSLRLNFEFNLECYDWDFALKLDEFFQSRLQQARQVTLEEVDERSIPVRLRDGLARLLSPFM